MENNKSNYITFVKERPKETVVIGGYIGILLLSIVLAIRGTSIESNLPEGYNVWGPNPTSTPVTQEKFPPSIQDYYATVRARGTEPVVPLRRDTPTPSR